jgi:hypothetical protein
MTHLLACGYRLEMPVDVAGATANAPAVSLAELTLLQNFIEASMTTRRSTRHAKNEFMKPVAGTRQKPVTDTRQENLQQRSLAPKKYGQPR